MMTRFKRITSLTTLTLFVLVLFCDASVASGRDRVITEKEVRVCISEVNRNADYGDATRVVHWIVELDQKNPVELEIRIETAVYSEHEAAAVNEYQASCVTGALGGLVRFRMRQTGQSD